MPRFLDASKVSVAEKQARASHYRTRGYKGFVDEFPIGFGTLPEKIVYWALSQRNIPFLYLNDVRLEIPEIGFDEFRQADFIIPSLRIIIEVQGAHWHSMGKTIEEDAFKFALYQQTGWRPLAWWDYEIIDNVNKLFADDPQLSAASHYDGSNKSGEMAVERRTKTDTSKGIRTLNKRRAARLVYRKKPIKIGKRSTKLTKGYGIYAASK